MTNQYPSRCRGGIALLLVLATSSGAYGRQQKSAVARTDAPAIAAVVRHAPVLSGRVEGTIRQLTAENVSLNGNSVVTGDLLVPGTPTVRLNGQPNFGGVITGSGSATPSNHRVTLNGNSRLGHLVTRTDPISMPDIAPPPAPSGTRNVELSVPGQSVGDWATVRDLTLNGNYGVIQVPPGTYGRFVASGASGFELGVAGPGPVAEYNLQQLTMNGQTELRIVGPVQLTLNAEMSINGTVGNASSPTWLTLDVAQGGISLNGTGTLHASVHAPQGTVTINGNARLIGNVESDRLTINGNGVLTGAADSLPPTLVITNPPTDIFVGTTTITVSAHVLDDSPTSVSINGIAASITGNIHRADVSLVEGQNTITVVATDTSNNMSTATRTVIVDTTPPVITIMPTNGSQPAKEVRVEGRAVDATPVNLHVADFGVALDSGGNFAVSLPGFADGTQLVEVTAVDAAGNSATAECSVVIDSSPPVVSLTTPSENGVFDVSSGAIDIRGVATDFAGVSSVVIDRRAATVGSGGELRLDGFPAAEGENHLIIMATDVLGNTGQQHLVFIGKDLSAPTAPIVFPQPSTVRLRSIAIDGIAEPGSQVLILGGLVGVTTSALTETGYYSANVDLQPGPNTLSVRTADGDGNTSEASIIVIDFDNDLPLPAPGESFQIHVSTGGSQRCLVDSELPRPLIAIVTDRDGEPVEGVHVVFSALVGGGHMQGGGTQIQIVTDGHGHASIPYFSGPSPAVQIVRADFAGNTSSAATFTAEAFEPTPGATTSVSGLVLDENLRALPNVVVRLGGQEVQTLSDGQFRIVGVPAGPHQLIEVLARDSVPYPGRWPNISFDLDVLPGVDNHLGRPLFVPKVNEGVDLPLDSNGVATQDTEYELPAIGGEPPIRVTVRQGTRVTFPPDVTDKRFSVTRIPRNRIPMALEDGLSTNLFITIQPGGAVFDPPLELSFPNLDGLAPGTKVSLMTFDHGAGRYVRVGVGHVSSDGKEVTSDPGDGIHVGAWEGFPGPPPPSACIAADTDQCPRELWADGERAVAIGTTPDGDSRYRACVPYTPCFGSGPAKTRLKDNRPSKALAGEPCPSAMIEAVALACPYKIKAVKFVADTGELIEDSKSHDFRIFPDATTEGGSAKRRVKVRVQVVPADANVMMAEVTLRAFDVDDATGLLATGHGNDNLGIHVRPADNPNNAGVFVDSGFDEVTKHPDAAGFVEAIFEVTTQPGDNFRMAASCVSSTVTAVTIVAGKDDKAAIRLSAPALGVLHEGTSDNSKKGDEAVASRLLTVWRKVHFEIDSSKDVPAETILPTDPIYPERNFLKGTVASMTKMTMVDGKVITKFQLSPEVTTPALTLDDGSNHLPGAVPPAAGTVVVNGRFETGRLRINPATSGGNETIDSLDGNGTDFVQKTEDVFLPFEIVDSVGGNKVVGKRNRASGIKELDAVAKTLTLGTAITTGVNYHGGTVTVAGRAFAVDSVAVDVVTLTDPLSLDFLLTDDDSAAYPFTPSTELLTAASDNSDATKSDVNLLAAAYIWPVYDLTSSVQAPFNRNVKEGVPGPNHDLEQKNQVADGKEHTSSDDYWVIYVQGAYQEEEVRDFDPFETVGDAILGWTTETFGCLVFGEVIHDLSMATVKKYPVLTEDFLNKQTTAHEIGHMFKLSHKVHGIDAIMKPGFPLPGDLFFNDVSLKAIRSTVKP